MHEGSTILLLRSRALARRRPPPHLEHASSSGVGPASAIGLELVPTNSFAEYAPEPNPATGKKDVVWFALNDDQPLFAFGGFWTEFKGDRGTKSKPIPGPHLVF